MAIGWVRDGDGLTLPGAVAGAAMAEAVATLKNTAVERKAERDRAEREKLRKEREEVARATPFLACLSARDLTPALLHRPQAMRKKTEEKERLRKAMEADRREISARGPAEAIRAKPLPTGNSGVNRLNLEEDPRDAQPQG